MQVRLELVKAGKRLHAGVYDIDDPESFGAAWKDVWVKSREQWMAKATSIGDLMNSIHEGIIGDLDGAEIKLSKL